jgi:cholesterol transport system auxiliary component
VNQPDLITTSLRRMQRSRWARRVASIGLVMQLLSACASAPPPATFDLTAPSKGVPGRPLRGQLIVSEPSASSPLDSDRIVIRTGPLSLALLKDTQWVDPLPALVQSRLIQTFENGHLLRSVGYPGQGITADYVLDSEIRRFDVDSATGQATVEISAKLINAASGRVLAAQIFSGQAPGAAADGASASAALDSALGQVMKQIVAWTAAKV